MLLIREYTNYEAYRTTNTDGERFDFYLKEKGLDLELNNELIFNGMAYLEVSGIKKENEKNFIKKRFRSKAKRAKLSKIFKPEQPFFICIIEFSKPMSFMEDIRSGSFVIEINITIKKDENLDLFITPEVIVDNYLGYLRMVNENKTAALLEKISDPNYLSYFISQSKNIAPDGYGITSVDFLGKRDSIYFDRLASDIPLHLSQVDDDAVCDDLDEINVDGILNYASARSSESIGVKDDSGTNYTIDLNDGLEEYVRQYFKRRVNVKGYGKDKRIIKFMSISPLDE